MPSLANPINGAAVLARFPELANDHPTELLDEAAKAAMQIYSLRREGALHLAAHLAVCWRWENTGVMDGGSGVIQQETVGPKMAIYANMTGNSKEGRQDGFFERTGYGRTYLILRDTSPRRMMPFIAG